MLPTNKAILGIECCRVVGTIKFLLSGNHSVNQDAETSELYRGRRCEQVSNLSSGIFPPAQDDRSGGSGACGQERCADGG